MRKCIVYGALFLTACGQRPQQQAQTQQTNKQETITRPDNFGADVAFLKEHAETLVLTDSTSKAAIAIVPAWQGRVMTSTAAGNEGRSLGWMDHDLITDKKQVHAYGGEDLFLLGPEGSQNTFYFAPGDTFNEAHWRVPAALDTASFKVIAKTKGAVTFERDMQLTNYKGHVFDIKVTRTITLIARRDLRNYIGTDIHKSVQAVGFHSANSIRNIGTHKWDTAYGTAAVWIAGMFPVTDKSTVIFPVRNNEKIVYFKADTKHRMDKGISQNTCYNYFGSYDAEHKLLTIVEFTLPTTPQRYENNAITAHSTASHYYRLTSSSPAAALKPGGSIEHYHRTIHLSGDDKHLDPIVKKVFGVSIAQIKRVL